MKTCPICGKEFEWRYPAQKYCSKSCYKVSQKGNRQRQNAKLAAKRMTDPEAHKKHRDYMREYMRKRAAKKRAEAMQQPTTTGTNA